MGVASVLCVSESEAGKLLGVPTPEKLQERISETYNHYKQNSETYKFVAWMAATCDCGVLAIKLPSRYGSAELFTFSLAAAYWVSRVHTQV